MRTAASPPVNSSLPTISGTAQQGHTLTASNGSWGGVTPITYTYQWQRCNSSGSSCGSISKATNQNYVASSGDVGRTIRVEVTATNADGKSQALSAADRCDRCDSAMRRRTRSSRSRPGRRRRAGRSRSILAAGRVHSRSRSPISGRAAPLPTRVCTNVAGATRSSFRIGASQVGTRLRATVTRHQLGRENLGLLEPDDRRPREGERTREREPAGDLRLCVASGQRCRLRRVSGRASLPAGTATSGVAVTPTGAPARISPARPVRATVSARPTSAWRSG